MKKIIAILFALSALFITTVPVYAATLPGIQQRTFKESGCLYNGGVGIGNVLTIDCLPVIFINLIYFALLFAGIVALFLIIFGGIKFITSGGDPKQLDGARKTIVWAVIGLIVIIMSFAIVRLVSDITGVKCIREFGFQQCDTGQ